jgi:hypothetical protein
VAPPKRRPSAVEPRAVTSASTRLSCSSARRKIVRGPARSTLLLPGAKRRRDSIAPLVRVPLAAEQAHDVAHRREGEAVGGDEEARPLELCKGCPARAESGLSARGEPPKRDCPIRGGDKDVAVDLTPISGSIRSRYTTSSTCTGKPSGWRCLLSHSHGWRISSCCDPKRGDQRGPSLFPANRSSLKGPRWGPSGSFATPGWSRYLRRGGQSSG